jgi:hypothetical protein
MSLSATSPVRLKAAQKRREAVRLRVSGLSIREVARSLKVSRARAHQYVQEALAATAAGTEDEVAQLRALTAARYEALLAGQWDKATKDACPKAAMVCVRILDGLVRLYGLAPKESKGGGEDGLVDLSGWSEEQLREEGRRLGILPRETVGVTYSHSRTEVTAQATAPLTSEAALSSDD